MEVFDKDGNPLEGVFSKEEVEAQIEAAKQQAIADAKTEADRLAAEGKKEEEIPAWAKPLLEKVGALETHTTKSFLGKVTSGLDTDKKNEIEKRYEGLQGYENTPEGLSRRAEDAYLLVTHEKFNAGTVDMSNLSAAGGGKTNFNVKETSGVDKEIQKDLGITQADVEKYSKK